MNQTAFDYIKEHAHLAGKKVIEIGSLDESSTSRGFDIRRLFPDREYIGIDVRDGPGVDCVMNSHRLIFQAQSIDTVICAEMLEHDNWPWVSALEMARVLVPRGTLIVTACGNGYPRHDSPVDCYRYTAEGLKALFEWVRLKPLDVRENNDVHGVYGVFQKP